MTPAKKAKAGAKAPASSRTAQRKARANFYERALSEAEAEYVKRAANVQGLDEEIAVLRAKLLTALEDQPDDFALLLKGVGTLSRTLATRHRLADKAEKDLFDNLVGTLRGLGEQLFPEQDNGGVD